MTDREALAALERIFALDSAKGATVIRSTPRYLAEEVLRELTAQGYGVTLRSEPRQPTLDEGLLARALHKIFWPGDHHDEGDTDCACCVDEIAAEYRRLAQERETTT